MEMVRQGSSIPVPRLIDHGTYADGRRYLTTEYIQGFRLDTLSTRSCSKLEDQKHTADTPCKDCLDAAYSHALEFISSTVLPQLSSRKSSLRGINGFVCHLHGSIPDTQPPWVGKGPWKTLPSELPEYVFQHDDISAHNIILDTQTLRVKELIDFEYTGCYPPGMEN